MQFVLPHCAACVCIRLACRNYRSNLNHQYASSNHLVGIAETVEVQLQLELPAQLKQQLLDQYDAIHDDNKLVPLPRRPNVMQIFRSYVTWVKDKKQESQAEEDIVMGLQVQGVGLIRA